MNETYPKQFVFVLMPFDKKFDDIYELGIKDSCISAGAYCERVDEQIFDENIIERVYNQISKADIIISDMTDKNPNVFYETGYAHALGKRVILLTQNSRDIPFDLKQYTHIIYKSISELKPNLQRRIEWYIENPKDYLSKIDTNVHIYMKDKLLVENEEIDYKTESNDIRIQIHNSSNSAIIEGSIIIGILSPKRIYYGTAHKDFSKVIKLPNASFLHYFDEIEKLFPDAWETLYGGIINKSLKVIIRVFTELGAKDYPINIIKI